MANPNPVQEQMLENAQGHLVPISRVKPIDIARNDLVNEITEKAKALQHAMQQFKDSFSGDIEAFIDLSAERYNVSLGSEKGNITLTSYDGKRRIVRSVADHIAFDEGLVIAK